MTGEERIRYLKGLLKCELCEEESTKICKSCDNKRIGSSAKCYDALEEAIKALEQEPCEDAISRAEVLDLCDSKDPDYKVKHFREDVECLTPVYPKSKTGHWIWCVGSHQCSNCEEYTCFSHKELLKYCPNCGAKMVES